MSAFFVGLMSGTSLDGIDAALADFGSDPARVRLQVLGHARVAIAATLKAELVSLNRSSADELHRASLAANALAHSSSELVATVLRQAGIARDRVVAIGSHGQTVRHRPGDFDGVGYTVQINAPALLAELTGIDVVADFRRRDVAAGGQGAPLVPAFHRAVFARGEQATAVLNLGGIANLTSLQRDGAVTGFDCGPANALLDLWCARSWGQSYDTGGTRAASGRVDARLLDSLLAEPYFARSPPKSTGRDLFNSEWLDVRLAASDARQRLRDEDVQATLAELTARVCADACRAHAVQAVELVVCGGGAFNADLVVRLGRASAPTPVVSSAERGLAPDQVEAVAFAWLAREFVARRPGNIAAVTGAAGPRILGALYPAG